MSHKLYKWHCIRRYTIDNDSQDIEVFSYGNSSVSLDIEITKVQKIRKYGDS